MIKNFLQYGQWLILLLSVMSLYLVSSVKHEARLNGYILRVSAVFLEQQSLFCRFIRLRYSQVDTIVHCF